MTAEDDMRVAREVQGSVDDVGMVHGRYGDEVGILDVEPPKPPPHWLVRLRALVRRHEQPGARPQ